MFQLHFFGIAAVPALTVALTASTGLADLVVGAVAVSGPPPHPNSPWENTIEHIGLAPDYVSGVTDFQTYIAANPTHSGGNFEDGFTTSNPPFNVDYDLGSSHQVTNLLFWNYRFSAGGAVSAMTVFTSATADFAAPTNVGSFMPNNGPGGNPVPLQVFDLADSVARYVRLNITGRYAGGSGVGISEVAFAAAVPEASAFLLVGAAAIVAATAAGVRQRLCSRAVPGTLAKGIR